MKISNKSIKIIIIILGTDHKIFEGRKEGIFFSARY